MKKQKASLSKKLKGNAGETIAEVLIALLIAALALTMLASVISTAAKKITQSKQQMDAYYTANEWLSSQSTANESYWTVSVKDTAGNDVKLTAPNEITNTVKVNYQINNVVENIPVVAFWKAG